MIKVVSKLQEAFVAGCRGGLAKGQWGDSLGG